MTSPREYDIQRWLADLAIRCEPRSKENLKVIVAKYAEGLADLPYEAFTPAACEGAARQWETFPSYKALRSFLENWAEKHKPAVLLLPVGEGDSSIDDEDRAWIRGWLRNESGDWGENKTGTEANLRMRLQRLHRNRPQAARWLIQNNDHANRIARELRLSEVEEPIDVSEAGIARNLIALERKAEEGKFGQAIASMLLAALRKNVAARAPERLHLLPDVISPQRQEREPSDRRHDAEAEASARAQINALNVSKEDIDAAAAAFEQRTGRKPGQLSPEQLAAVRKEAGIPHHPHPTIDGEAEEIPKRTAEVIDLWGFDKEEQVA